MFAGMWGSRNPQIAQEGVCIQAASEGQPDNTYLGSMHVLHPLRTLLGGLEDPASKNRPGHHAQMGSVTSDCCMALHEVCPPIVPIDLSDGHSIPSSWQSRTSSDVSP